MTDSTRRIAVLPLANISQDPDDEYLADGMTEELISTISKIAGLGVIARTSIMRYKKTSKSIVEIGKELGVESVVEGSIRKAGTKLRISAQLVDASTEQPIWTETYDRDVQDALTIQKDIAERIANALKIEVVKNGVLRSERSPTQSLEAYEYYLKGRVFLNRRTEDDLKKAIDSFASALRRDPEYALAYSGLADSHAATALLEFVPPKDAFPLSLNATENALSIDSGLAEAHASLGLLRFQYLWDWTGSELEFKRALEINSNYAATHQFYADYLKAMGRFDEALAEMSRAQALDPLSLSINTGIGHVLYLSRQYDRALEQYEKTIDIDPTFLPSRLWYGRPLLQKGMYKEAIAELTEAVKLSRNSTVSLAMLGQAYGAAGNKKAMEGILEKLRQRSKTEYVASYWIAMIYVGRGDKDQAFAWFDRAFQERSSWLVWIGVEPRLDVLRSDSRFGSLLGKMQLFPEKKELGIRSWIKGPARQP